MPDNIISKERVEDHTVQRYRFKVLGTPIADVQPEVIADTLDDKIDTEAIFAINTPMASPQEETQKSFVEELLKKTDELTTHVIKLQLQIEKQENEFNQRLMEELKRERENAYTQGYQKAKEELEENMSEIKSRYLKSIQQLDALANSIEKGFGKLETEISTTAYEIAKEVIKKEVSHDSAQIAILLSKELIKDIKEASSIELKVHPKDLEVLKEVYAKDEKIKVSADDAIALGGVVLLSDVGNLDGSLPMRLEKVKYLIQES